MPYIEPNGWATDYWTGFYTSRPHLKQLVFQVHHEIMATKVLMVNAFLAHNNYTLKLSSEQEMLLQQVNDLITSAK